MYIYIYTNNVHVRAINYHTSMYARVCMYYCEHTYMLLCREAGVQCASDFPACGGGGTGRQGHDSGTGTGWGGLHRRYVQLNLPVCLHACL